jgi:hypothetical protein
MWRPLYEGPMPTRTQLLDALDGITAECRILFADLTQRLKLRVVTPRLKFLDAIPDLNDGTFRCSAVKRGECLCTDPGSSAYGHLTTTMRLDEGLHFGGIFLAVGVRIVDVDLRDEIDRRLGLRVQP